MDQITLSRPQSDIAHSTKRLNLFMAGQGSGKTHNAGVVSYTFIYHFPELRGIIAANTHEQLNKATMFRIRQVWKEYFSCVEYNPRTQRGHYTIGKKPPAHFNTDGHNFETYHNIISFMNGTVIFIGSLDNYKALEGQEVGWAILDETKDTKEEAVKEVILGRIRQPGMYLNKEGKITTDKTLQGYNPLFIFTSPAKVKWLNEWFELDKHEKEINSQIYNRDTYFMKTTKGSMVTISSVYLNEHNLPPGWIENQKNSLASHLHDMLIYGSPFSKTGGEFYKTFVRKNRVGSYKYNRLLPLHITWDENVQPHLTCLVHQVNGKKAMQIQEICAKSPNNKLDYVCSEFIREYPGHEAGLFIYGDPSSQKDDVKQQKGHNFYTLIRDRLKQYKPIMRVAKAAPSVVMRGNFLNTVFEKNFAGINLLYDESCTTTLADYANVKEDADGTKLKKKITDKQTGISYEEWGHCSDANDYFYCEIFKKEFTLYLKGDRTVDYIIGKREQSHGY